MRKPLFYLFVPLGLASKIYQMLVFFLETFLVIVFSYFVLILYEIAPFLDPFEIEWGPKGHQFWHHWHRKGSKGDPVGAKNKHLLVLFGSLPAGRHFDPPPRPPPGIPRAALFMDLAYISTSLGYFFLQQQRIRAPRTQQKQRNAPTIRGPPKTSRRIGGVFQCRVRGEVNLPPGGSEVRKKGRKEEGRKGG